MSRLTLIMYRHGGGSAWGGLAISFMTLGWFLAYVGYILVGFYQMHARPYRHIRTAVILFRLQVRINQVSRLGPTLMQPGAGLTVLNRPAGRPSRLLTCGCDTAVSDQGIAWLP